MERSEPSLVPEWLRSTGGGNLSHHVSSSKTDGPLLALPRRNRILNSSSYSDAPHSSVLERSSSTNSRRSSSSNGSSKHDKNPYSRSYSGSARNQRAKDREKLGIPDIWDSEYSDPLASIIGGRTEKDTLRRSNSMISRRPDEFMQRKSFTDLRNKGHNINGNGNGPSSVGNASTSTQKVSFERDFPLLGSDERPTTPDIARVPSPGLSRGVQGLSIGTSPLIGCEGWTSALVEVPVVGSNSIASSPTLLPAPSAVAAPPSSVSTSSEPATPNGLNMAEALVQGPLRPQNVPQQLVSTQRFEELPSVGTKKLIPMTSSMPKTSVLNPSDKLKPKTAARSIDSVAGPKNGLQQMPSLQLGSQAVRGGSGRVDGLNSSSSKLQLLKTGREKVASPALKDVPAQAIKVTNVVANGPSTGSSSVASFPSKSSNNMKLSKSERKTSGYSLNGGQVMDKRSSHAYLQSRNDFFNLVRKNSMGGVSTVADSDSGAVISSAVLNSGEEKELASDQASLTENGSAVNCNGDTCKLSESFSHQRGRDLSHHELIHPEEELHFLRALGWEDDDGDDEGLTEEEISAFVQKYMKWRPESKLLQGLQSKIMAESSSPASCSTGASSEPRTADSSL
ncbi:hypothetical protein BVRB_1g000410 [Beta vulgaris subsp. vulgaris]|uniref:uncharacterized protein LOC104888222 n=1 Tax=Beta vulgaris subsp. vulgaris TaxID=3555 RepID=UPI0005401C5E|nr:uncharacterized protein LOC104888222 [Beta vulgaris subsp. vulgaris]XP_010671539.1 uncharacterized protein LOC104888222 [Beta vulgaris subsp. vulgaris]XP_010671612.1 uncharacterized protein LOC104888222 [Beta vulgaris subsp. vulgaris]KMT20021.1 hypothetical protein BVRB_1g000410 [Beta vulgaris subsp. vulgaris]